MVSTTRVGFEVLGSNQSVQFYRKYLVSKFVYLMITMKQVEDLGNRSVVVDMIV